MNYKINILAMLAVFCAIFVHVNTAEAQEFTAVKDLTQLNKEISLVAANTKTIIADFVQEKHLDVLDIVVESKGVFIYKDPQKLRWEYKTPYKYLVLMNNGKMSIVQDNKVQEFDMKSSDALKSLNDMMLNAIKGDILQNINFKTSVFENAKSYKVRLVPKNNKVNVVLSAIEVLINRNSKTVDQFTMYESDTDYTQIRFLNKKINQDVADGHFINN